MKKRSNYKNNNKIVKLLYILIVTTIVVSMFSLAKYKNTYMKAEETRVALLANDVTVPITGFKGKPGDTYVMPLVITNEEDGNVCEVAQEFTMRIDKTNNLPLQMALYSDENCTQIIGTDENGAYSSADYAFEAGVEDEKTFYLKIEWTSEYKSSYYSLEIDAIMLRITVNQID